MQITEETFHFKRKYFDLLHINLGDNTYRIRENELLVQAVHYEHADTQYSVNRLRTMRSHTGITAPVSAIYLRPIKIHCNLYKLEHMLSSKMFSFNHWFWLPG